MEQHANKLIKESVGPGNEEMEGENLTMVFFGQ